MTGNDRKAPFFRIILFLIMVPFLFPGLSENKAQDPPLIDSLKQILVAARQDTSHVNALLGLGDYYYNSLPDTASYYFREAYDISEELGFETGKANSLRGIGTVLQLKGDNDAALDALGKAKDIFLELGDKRNLATCYNNLGYTHKLKSEFDIAVEYFYRALEIADEFGDLRQMARTYNNIGSVHQSNYSNDKAIEAFQKALDLYMELEYSTGVGICYVNLGITYFNKSDYQKALEYHEKALEIHRENNNKQGISICIGNMAEIYRQLGQYDKAIEYSLQSVGLYEEMGFKEGMASAYGNAANLNLQLADSLSGSPAQRRMHLLEAVAYGNRALELAREMNSIQYESMAANDLFQAYKRLENYRKAAEYAEIVFATKDSLYQEDKTNAILEIETKYETEKKQQQIELQESQIMAQEATIKQQKTLRNALAAGLASVVLVVGVFIYAYVQKRKANKKILEQNEQITEANEELRVLNEAINQQNVALTDSISYAERIQSAMLPPETYINELFNENFILYKPRDIVSGDFFWAKQVNQYVILVAADCTGHGVPGAFMSLLGISYLTEIVQRREITQANQVLNELRRQIKNSLRQHGGRDEAKDGIDMALCVLNLKNRVMQFSGANNPLYLIREQNGETELEEIKPDHMPLGYFQGRDRSFTNHDIRLEEGDTFYIFSDGFIDQKGGKENKRYMSRAFKKLLLEIQDFPMPDQKEVMDSRLNAWMGNNSQTDDILVIGVRI